MVWGWESVILLVSFLRCEINITDQVNSTVFHNSAYSCSVPSESTMAAVVNMPKLSDHCQENNKCAGGLGTDSSVP